MAKFAEEMSLVDSPLVSVVIPTFNSAWSLEEAIHSVLAQTYRNFEVFVVDDGSTDNTAEIIANCCSDKVTYIRQENKGVSVARNHGILSSHGKYIAFLDSDDVWFPTKIEMQVSFMEKNADLGVVFSDYCHTDVEGVIGESKIVRLQTDEPVYYQLLGRNFICTSTVMVRLTALAKSGIFSLDLRGIEDYDLWLRLAKVGEFGSIDSVLTAYRKHQQNTVNTTSFSRQEANFCFRLWQSCQNDSKARTLLKPKLARVFRKLGEREWLDGRYAHARKAIQKSIKYGGFRKKSAMLLLASFLPPVVARKMMSVRTIPQTRPLT